MERAETAADVAGDLRRGFGVSAEDLAIATLVVAPFTLTLGIWVGWLTWWPSSVLIGITLVAQVLATLWNAGWRARTAA